MPWKIFSTLFMVASVLTMPTSARDLKSTEVILEEKVAQIKLEIPDASVVFETIEITGREFQKIDIEADGVIGEPGGPSLPSWSRWIEVPQGKHPTISFNFHDTELLSEIDISPFPTINQDKSGSEVQAVTLSELYDRDEFFPEIPVVLSEVFSVGGKKMALIDMMPFSFNPSKRQLRIHRDLEVEIDFEDIPEKQSTGRKFEFPVYRQLERLYANGEPGRDDIGMREDLLGHYVIVVANDGLLDELEPLIEWKERKGFKVSIADLREIGNRRENLEAYLQDAWDEWEIPPTFVLLTGDVQGQIPNPYFHDNRGERQGYHASQNQFVCWEGDAGIDSWIPEGFIGRLPAATPVELHRMVQKILAYENTPFVEEPWVEGAVLIAHGVGSCIQCNVAVRELMMGVGYIRDNIHEAYANWFGGERPNHGVIFNGINAGVGFINFRGFQTWGDIFPNQIRNLRNGSKLPVVTGMVCGTNDYTNTWNDTNPESRGEAYLRSWNNNDGARGGVACFGPSDLHTHTWFNNTMDGAFYHALLNEGVYTLGALSVSAKLSLLDNYPSYRQNNNGQSVGYYFYTYNIMGDPGMQVWTRDPQALFVDFTEEKPTGTSLIKATISFGNDQPVPGAYVHVFRMLEDEEIRYGGYTDEEGRLSIVVDPLQTGEYLMTVTGPNLIPVETSFEVIDQPVYTTILETAIDDDGEGQSSGNEDTIINPGETIELGVMISNSGDERSESFTTTLLSRSPWIELVNAEAQYPEIEPGEFEEGEVAYVFSCSPEMPDGIELGFELLIDYGEEQWREGFNLNTVGYSFEIIDFEFANDGLAPGVIDDLIVTIENNGELDALPIRASLHSIDPKIQIREAETFLGAIEIGQQVRNSRQPFEIFAAPNSYPMCEVSFGLLLEDDTGRSDSLIIPVLVGGNVEIAPQGPTNYGYWAFDSRDTTGGMNPEYDWAAGNNNANLRLNDQDDGGANNMAGMHGQRALVDLPWDFIYHGNAYNLISVSSNGWMCFGRSDQVSWNNQEMGSPLAPPAMLCPFWTDLWSGQIFAWHDDEADRFIIEWRNCQNRGGSHTFAVHLYNPEVIPTQTGDGEFIFLYERGNVNAPGRDYPEEAVTIGFSSPDRNDGMTITHARDWDPRTEDLEEDMAVRFTTGPLSEFGSIHGTVIAAEGDLPMEGVRVMLDGTGFFSLTDENGEYFLENAPVGTYDIIAQRRYFNDAVSEQIEIIEDEDVEVNFIMTYPTFNIDVEELNVQVWPDSTADTAFEIWNEGNGPLDFEIVLNPRFEDPEMDIEWGEIFNYAVGDSVDDSGLYGVAFDGENFYISGQVSRREFPHMLYVFDRDGNHREDVQQYNIDSSVTRGYTEIDFNGENLVAVEQRRIVTLTREGAFVDSFTTEENPTQAMTWSPDRGTFFAKSMTGRRFYEYDTIGNVVNEFEYEGETIYSIGMTWFAEDPEGFNLYIFAHNRHPDEVGDRSRLELRKMNPETGEIRLIRYLRFEGMTEDDRPLGCVITNRWNPLLWTFIGLINVTPKDRLVGFEIGPNLSWISYDPQIGSVQPEERQSFGLSVNSIGMPEQDYSLVLELFHNAEGDRFDIPLLISIGEVSVSADNLVTPTGFGLSAAWPNPFNPSTKLDFYLPFNSEAGIMVWDVSGRLVNEFHIGNLSSGSHSFEFDGSDLASGVYIIQLTAGNLVTSRKVVLMR